MTGIENSEGFWFMEKDGLHMSVDLRKVTAISYSEPSRAVRLFYGGDDRMVVVDVDSVLYANVIRCWTEIRRKS
jgi:hypothetical protein